MRKHRLYGFVLAMLLGTAAAAAALPNSQTRHLQAIAGSSTAGPIQPAQGPKGIPALSSSVAAPHVADDTEGVSPLTGRGTQVLRGFAMFDAPAVLASFYSTVFVDGAPAPAPQPAPAAPVSTPAPQPAAPAPQPAAPAPAATATPQQTQVQQAQSSSLSADFAELRQCESGDDYSADTGNGYYGAYQFTLSTWEELGYAGLPSDAPPGTQDQAAMQLQASSGWGQWPACSQELGLT